MFTAMNHFQRRSTLIALTQRMISERQRLIIGVSGAAAAVSAMTSALYESMGVDYAEIVDDLPAAFDSMLGDADLSTAAGFLHLELFSLLAPVLVVGAAISVGASTIAGAEEENRLMLITSSSIRRSMIMTAGLLSVVVTSLSVSAGLFVGVLGGGAIGELDLAVSNLVSACLNTALLGIAIGTITLAAGATTGSRSIAVTTGITISVLSYVIDSFFPLSKVLEPVSKISLWYLYATHQPIANGIKPAHALILGSVAVAASITGYWGFGRRDLRS